MPTPRLPRRRPPAARSSSSGHRAAVHAHTLFQMPSLIETRIRARSPRQLLSPSRRWPRRGRVSFLQHGDMYSHHHRLALVTRYLQMGNLAY